jgi:putative hydroxymethylpyrimidine transport system permease protein
VKLILRILCVFTALILFWQGIVIFWHIPKYLLPSPFLVFSTLYEQHALILTQAIPTIVETTFGFLLGVLFGCFAGLVITFFKPLRFWFWPILIMSQAIPTFAIAPLLVIWLGYGLASKIATTVLMIFFPITSAFYDGLRRTSTGWLDLAKTMNAKKWRIFYYIRLPAALPDLASGIRIAAVAAPIGAIVGEWVGSSQGLGYLMLNANARMQIDMMFAALIVIIALSLILYFCVDTILRSLVTWQEDK